MYYDLQQFPQDTIIILNSNKDWDYNWRYIYGLLLMHNNNMRQFGIAHEI